MSIFSANYTNPNTNVGGLDVFGGSQTDMFSTGSDFGLGDSDFNSFGGSFGSNMGTTYNPAADFSVGASEVGLSDDMFSTGLSSGTGIVNDGSFNTLDNNLVSGQGATYNPANDFSVGADNPLISDLNTTTDGLNGVGGYDPAFGGGLGGGGGGGGTIGEIPIYGEDLDVLDSPDLTYTGGGTDTGVTSPVVTAPPVNNPVIDVDENMATVPDDVMTPPPQDANDTNVPNYTDNTPVETPTPEESIPVTEPFTPEELNPQPFTPEPFTPEPSTPETSTTAPEPEMTEAYFEQLPDNFQEEEAEFVDYDSPFNIEEAGKDIAQAINFDDPDGRIQEFLNDLPALNDISLSQEGRQRAEDYMYDQFTSRLDPQFEEAQNELVINLRNRGLVEGDAAYDAAIANFERGKNDAYQQAKFTAVNQAGAETQRNFDMDSARRAQIFGEAAGMSQDQIERLKTEVQKQSVAVQGRQADNQAKSVEQQGVFQQAQMDLQNRNQVFNQELSMANYQNQVRQQQIAEEMGRRSQALNELNALLSGTQISNTNFQNFSQAGNAGGVNYTGAAQDMYSGNLNSFNASQAQLQGLMSGGAGMFGAGMFG